MVMTPQPPSHTRRLSGLSYQPSILPPPQHRVRPVSDSESGRFRPGPQIARAGVHNRAGPAAPRPATNSPAAAPRGPHSELLRPAAGLRPKPVVKQAVSSMIPRR